LNAEIHSRERPRDWHVPNAGAFAESVDCIHLMKTTGFTVNAKEPVRAWVNRTVTGLMESVLPRARDEGSDPVETAHLIRVAAKQLRALLRLLRRAVSAKAFECEDARLKTAADWLAPGRDRTVARETLTSLVADAAPGRSRETLARLQYQLDEHTTNSQEHGSGGVIARAAPGLEKAGLLMKRMRLAGDGWDDIRRGLVKVYRRTRRRMKEALSHPDDEAFHRWRIPAKQLYYQLQWLEPVWPGRFSKMVRQLHRLEKKLGSDHDLAVLKEMLLSPAAGFIDAASACELRRTAGKRSRRLRQKCQSLGEKLFCQSPQAFAKQCGRHWREWLNGGGT
jgi:CHAD domain-containing protein